MIQSLSDEALRVLYMDEGGALRAMAPIARPHAAPPALPPPAPGRLRIRSEAWLATALASENPLWVDVERTPDGAGRAVAFVGKAGPDVLASMIDYGRFGRLLGSIAVGRTGGSFVVGPQGGIVIAPTSDKRILAPELAQVANAAGERVAARRRPAGTSRKGSGSRSTAPATPWRSRPCGSRAGSSRSSCPRPSSWPRSTAPSGSWRSVSPSSCSRPAGWSPPAPGASWPTRSPASPRTSQQIERFQLEGIPHRRSRLVEIDRLSGAIARMAAGLADFAKFIPTELVRSLLQSGVRAEPGGERRELTVLFADLAGFTGLSERLGDGVVPIVGQFLELASQAVEAEGGTVDKFIGDAIMAFWGAPSPDPDQALHACRAALAIAAGMRAAAERGEPLGELRVRIGLNTGPAIVGNVGSTRRLNYTALGDTVNLASRLEGVNKVYGTTILMSAATKERGRRRGAHPRDRHGCGVRAQLKVCGCSS